MKNRKIIILGIIGIVLGVSLLGTNLTNDGYRLNTNILKSLTFIFGSIFILSTFNKSTKFEFVISERTYKLTYRIFGIICLIMTVIL